jgi:hypothetical protein
LLNQEGFMIKYVRATAILMLGFSMSFAQYEFETPAPEAPSAPTAPSYDPGFSSPSPEPVPMPKMEVPTTKPVKMAQPAGEGGYQAYHSPVYSDLVQGNAAADFSIADLRRRPNLIQGNQMVAAEIGANQQSGFLANDAMGGILYMSLENSDRSAVSAVPGLGNIGPNSLFTMGYGGGANTFAVGLRFGMLKATGETTSATGGASTDLSLSLQGSQYGLVAGMKLGNGGIYASFDNTTWGETSEVNNGTTKVTQTQDDLSMRGGFAIDATDASPYAIDISVGANFISDENNAPTTGPESRTEFNLNANLGAAIRSTNEYKVYVGAITDITYVSYDPILYSFSSSTETAVILTPTLAFEYQLSENLRGIAGASHDISWMMMAEDITGGPDANDAEVPAGTTSGQLFQNTETSADVGLRYTLNRLAFEAGVANSAFDNGISDLFTGVNVLYRAGVSVNIN